MLICLSARLSNFSIFHFGVQLRTELLVVIATKLLLIQENWWMAKGLVIYTKLFNLRATFHYVYLNCVSDKNNFPELILLIAANF
jgi:hypothetical protein